MFKLVDAPRAWFPVIWPGVTEDGKTVENRIEMRFRILSVNEGLKLLQDIQMGREKAVDEANDGKDVDLAELFAAWVMRFVENWRDLHGEDGKPLAWNAANLRLFMNVPGIFDAVLAAYKQCASGAAERRLGN